MQTARALAVVLVVLAGCENGGSPAEDDVGESDDSTEGDTGDATDTGDAPDTGDTTGTTGTTDATETEGETDEGSDGIGEADELATAACEAFANATPQMIIAAATIADAATATLVADGAVVYRVVLPEGAAGFVQLEIPDWETTQAFFTDEAIDYTVSTMQGSEVEGPRELDGACPEAGITDQRIYFEHWTPATIEFSATGPREIRLMIVRES